MGMIILTGVIIFLEVLLYQREKELCRYVKWVEALKERIEELKKGN